MAFNAAGLSKVAELGVNGTTLWAYFTLDAAATVAASGYFTGDAPNMLRIGDLIIRETVDALNPPTTITTWGIHIVLTNAAGVVDLSDALVGIVANAG